MLIQHEHLFKQCCGLMFFVHFSSGAGQNFHLNPSSLQTCPSDPEALFADLDCLPICVNLLYVCLSGQLSHLFKHCSFLLWLCACWAGFFFSFLGPFLLFWDQMARGHGSASFVQAPLWKEAVLPNVISGTGRVHFGLWKKTIGSGHI